MLLQLCIDNDGVTDLVVPVCMKKDCEDSRIYSHGLLLGKDNKLNPSLIVSLFIE